MEEEIIRYGVAYKEYEIDEDGGESNLEEKEARYKLKLAGRATEDIEKARITKKKLELEGYEEVFIFRLKKRWLNTESYIKKNLVENEESNGEGEEVSI